jgi:nitroimidazol reductase NimA-like FMN-containing flavoprotein (pyridoxamine 5'-phosphate oxidase superfamily)
MITSIDALVATAQPRDLSPDECRAVVERACFGHLAFAHHDEVEAVPIRFVSVEGWLYFRANSALRAAIAHNPWVAIAIAETLDATHMASVVARGGCYPTEQTGSTTDDARALRGIMRLRERVRDAVLRTGRSERTAIVFRMHVDSLHGRRMVVPDDCLSETSG